MKSIILVTVFAALLSGELVLVNRHDARALRDLREDVTRLREAAEHSVPPRPSPSRGRNSS
jgi:hypothetical protein